MKQSGYYRFPTIHDDTIAFVCEDDLWTVPASGGRAVRLTSNLASISRPHFSPDGQTLAFTGREEGNVEVYSMAAKGGREQRLTYLAGNSLVIGWSEDGKQVRFAGNAGQPFAGIFQIYHVDPDGGEPEQQPLGLAHHVSYGPEGRAVLGRNTLDTARWKRYRGGTRGVMWIDTEGQGEFKPFLHDLGGNVANPLWIGDRIYFISDHERMGHLYSATPTGDDIQKHGADLEYYPRNATTDGKRIAYQAGGEIYLFDSSTGETTHVEIEFHSPQIQTSRKFVSPSLYMEDYELHPQGHSILVTSRGQSYYMGNWEGASRQLGEDQGMRYRLAQWLDDGERFVTVCDRGEEEALEIHSAQVGKASERLEGIDIGRPLDLDVSPTDDRVALSNHRNELIVVDLEKKEAKVLARSEYNRIGGFSWSPDGKWLAFSMAETAQTFSLKLVQVETGEVKSVTSPRFRDFAPTFDPQGKFVYFLSFREFNPVYDSMYFDLGFPKGARPFLVSLDKETANPFQPQPKTPSGDHSVPAKKKDNGEEENKDGDKVEVKIDWEDIENRIMALPVPEGRYLQIQALRGKVLFSSLPVEGALGRSWFSLEPPAKATLQWYNFEEQKIETVVEKLTAFKVSRHSETLVYRAGNKLRVCAPGAADKSKESSGKKDRENGWIDLDRIRISVEPAREWKQMYREIWRLQRDQFWTEDMSKVDWEKIYERYLPILKKVAARTEFSDLIWEMQGELGTSHAYEMGGDHRKTPKYIQGYLAANFSYDESSQGYRVDSIVRGDSWDESGCSPLHQVGANVDVGDVLLAVNGRRLSKNLTPEELLVHQAGREVSLTIAGKNGGESRNVVVKTLRDDSKVRYREWVENNRKVVEEATNGQVGYVHIPDMGPFGYAEFHRYYLAEIDRPALIVDARYNRGGHVSQLLLEKLARKRLGYDLPRWGKPDPYPSDSVMGPMVALTNEYAGSDGDIFSHCFKLMKLGPLVGKRTWGGVIGIFPRHRLVDGSLTTQPEFSFWFNDVGWGVENYGTDPDIEVDIAPQDWVQGKDPQMEKALEIIRKKLDENPPKLPDFDDRPDLSLP